MSLLRFALLAPVLLAFVRIGFGQGLDERPQRVEVDELLRASGLYNGKTVIVAGELRSGDMLDVDANVFRVRGRTGFREARVGEPRMGTQNLRWLLGQRVEITGVFWDLVDECHETPYGLDCSDPRLREYGALREGWEREENRYFIGASAVDPLEDKPLPKEPEPKESEAADVDVPPGTAVDLRDLVRNAEPYLSKRVAVVGKFRGNNVYGDLSLLTKKTPRDFVIKVADAAIWVTGRRPRGKGFDLNPNIRRDTGKWLKVTGVPWTDAKNVYLKAERLEIVPDPEDPSLDPVAVEDKATPAAPAPPPEVTFTLPLEGERGIALDTEFRLQFSADMNAKSFDRNVDLLYADDDGSGNPFPDLQIRYEAAGRTLVVIPGRTLDPEKEIRLILYQGIVDVDGQSLSLKPGAEEVPQALVILTFFTASR